MERSEEMTSICGHIKAEHQFNGQFCYQCRCTRYQLDIKADKELIQDELKNQVNRRQSQ